MVEGIMMIGTCPYGIDYYSKLDIFWLKQTEWMLKLFPDRLLRNIISKMCGATSEGRRSMLKMLEGYEKKNCVISCIWDLLGLYQKFKT